MYIIPTVRCHRISSLVVKFPLAKRMPRVRFPADAFFDQIHTII